jgi:hypothetical protein
MVDTQFLEAKIAASGKTKKHLASKMGMSLQSFRLKSTNKYDFTTTQVDILCGELGITKLSEKEKIFFAKKVDSKST